MDITLSQAAVSNLRLVAEYRDAPMGGNLVDIGDRQILSSSNEAIAKEMSQFEIAEPDGMSYEAIFELFPVVGMAILAGSNSGASPVSWSFEVNIVPNGAAAVTVSAGELIPKA